MLNAAGKALSQLFDPAIFGVLALSIAGAAIVLLTAWFGGGALLEHLKLFESHWLDNLVRILIGVAGVFVTLALFGAIAAVIASLFIERIARAVERRYYPDLPPPRSQGMGEQIQGGIAFLLITVALNLLALPVYLIWGANLPVFLALNGYLLGREYFELVALRRIDRKAVARLRRSYPFRLILAGVAIVGLSFVPLANLLTPVVATCFMLHVFQGLPENKQGLPRLAVR